VTDNTPFTNSISLCQKYGPAMSITDPEEAAAYFERCVEHMMRAGGYTRPQAEEIERANLGYFAGYHDDNTRRRVETLFNCAHPVFGKIVEMGTPTPEEAFRLGQEMASGRTTTLADLRKEGTRAT
jgi:hypothetical protein